LTVLELADIRRELHAALDVLDNCEAGQSVDLAVQMKAASHVQIALLLLNGATSVRIAG